MIHVGRFHPGKRHDRLIEAYAQSGIDAPLVLLGQGNRSKSSACASWRKSYRLPIGCV
jgi:glycosyltransferase involved in cell wall biosynthesis